MNKGIAQSAFAILSAVLASTGRADVIYSNLPDDPTFAHGLAALAFGQVAPGLDVSLAMPFVVPSGPGYDLAEIEIALNVSPFTAGLPPFVARVTLLADAGGLPGAAVPGAEWELTELDFDTADFMINSEQTVSGIDGIVLGGGGHYWLAASAVDPMSQFRWWQNLTGQNGFAGSTDGGNSWSFSDGPTSAFALYGTPVTSVSVPEPGTLLLLVFGLSSLAVRALLSSPRRSPAT